MKPVPISKAFFIIKDLEVPAWLHLLMKVNSQKLLN